MSLFRKQPISLPLNIFKVMTHLQQTYLSLISLNKISPKLSVSRDLNVFEFNLRKFQEWQELALLTETEWDPEPLWMPKELDPCPVAVREHKPHPFLRVLLEACCLPRSLEDVVAVLQWQQCNTFFQTSSDLPINNLQESQWGLLNGCHMLNLVETLPPTMRSGLIKILKIKKKYFFLVWTVPVLKKFLKQ